MKFYPTVNILGKEKKNLSDALRVKIGHLLKDHYMV